jgi:hypothetical protein
MEATRTKEMTILAEIIVKKSKTLFLIYWSKIEQNYVDAGSRINAKNLFY